MRAGGRGDNCTPIGEILPVDSPLQNALDIMQGDNCADADRMLLGEASGRL